MITGFFHTGFVVEDLEAMVAFYRDVLGLTVLQEREVSGAIAERIVGVPGAHLRLAFLGREGERYALELLRYVYPPGMDGHQPVNSLGATHLSFYVQGLDEMHRELAGQGVRFINSPTLNEAPDGARRKVCYAQDPEGNWLEFIEVLA